jgi:hypothetical protein
MFALRTVSQKIFPIIMQQKSWFASKIMPKTPNIFADPTYDNTFKMLCTSKEHPEIIKSMINNFLNLSGDQEIQSVSFSQGKNTLKKDNMSEADAIIAPNELENDTRFVVDSTIDFLCITKSGKKIAIEMQRAHEDYFLSRSQLYMSKLIANQVHTGQSSIAHKVMLDTYIICIGKENIIRDKAICDKQKASLANKDKAELSFELTVTPIIHDLWVTIQDNKMTWKFFELTKFKTFIKKFPVSNDSPMKHQWLNFLLKCQDADNTPEDVAGIIKEGYDIMRMANWTPDQKVLYDMAINGEALVLTKIEEGEARGKAEGLAEGLAKGEAKGLAKGIKTALKYDPDANLATDFDLNTEIVKKIKNLYEPKEEQIIDILLGNHLLHNASELNDLSPTLLGDDATKDS